MIQQATLTPERSIRDMSRTELDEHLQQLAVTAGELRFQLEQHLQGNHEALTLLDQLKLCTEQRLDAWCQLGAHSSLSSYKSLNPTAVLSVPGDTVDTNTERKGAQ